MSTKTSIKRIALVAVSALGFGLLSVVPAKAAAAQPSAGTITAAASTNVSTGTGEFLSRTSFNSGILGGAITVAATSGFSLYLATAQGAAPATLISRANGGLTACSATDGDSTDAGTAHSTDGSCTIADASGTFASYTATFGDLAAGTYFLIADVNTTVDANNVSLGKLVVVNAGAPTSVSWTYPTLTEVNASAVDYDATFNVKDANGVNTVLLNNERVVFDVTPQTGAAATQVEMGTNFATIDEADTATTGLLYTARLSGDGSTPSAGSTVAGTTYTISGTLQDGTSALASPVSTRYTRLANTNGLTGTLSFRNSGDTASVSSLSAAPSTAATVFKVKALDSNGGPILGATVSLSVSGSLGSFTNGSQSTNGTGITASDITFTAGSTAGTGTVTATILAGGSSITNTLPVTVTATGATAATDAGWAVVANNGSGLVAGTAPNWTAAPNTSSFTATLSGVDANKTVKMILNNSQTATATANGIAKNNVFYPLANASGVVSVTIAASSFTNGQTIQLQADADNSGGYETELIITSETAAGAITTSPATSSLNMATPSSSNAITATVADQFGNRILGGSVTITNTTVPAGVTAATSSTVMTTNGVATVNAVIGATLGSYVFQVQARDPNGSSVGSASTITYQVTTTGIAGSLTLTDSDNSTGTLTTDNASTRAVVIAPATLSAGQVANTDNSVAITVTTATPAGLRFTATATNGIRLFTTTRGGAALTAGASSVSGTAGSSANLFAVPTKVGAGTITVTSGGITQTFTLTGALAASPKAQLVTLTENSNVDGKANYTVTTTDIFGNAVPADVNVVLSGAGSLSNGFKNLTVSTTATGTNSFDVISDGKSATGITATIASGSFQAITAAEATARALASASDVDATASVTVVQPVVPVKSAEVLAAEAAEAAAKKAGEDAVAAANAATVAAQKAATDAVAAAKAAGDAAVAAAVKAALDAVAASKAAQDAAVAEAQAATESALEAIDAANAATDAANLAAEAADAATVAAEEARDAADAATAAVEELATQISTLFATLRAQITTLGNTVAKIAKKVRA